MSESIAPKWCHVSLERPAWLPHIFWHVCQNLNNDGNLYGKRKDFFFNILLSDFWSNLESFNLDLSYAELFISCFFVETKIFGVHGTKDRPSLKNQIKSAKTEADKLMASALELAGKLADTLDKIAETAAYYPEEMALFSLIESMSIDGISFESYSHHSPIWDVKTSDALIKLTHALADFPRSKQLFEDNKLFESQKSVPADWLRVVISNLDIYCTKPNWNELKIRQVDWENIYRVFIEDSDSARDKIKDVIKTPKKH